MPFNQLQMLINQLRILKQRILNKSSRISKPFLLISTHQRRIVELVSLKELLGDWTQCLQDISQISTDAQAIEDDIKHFNIIKLAEDVDSLYNEVQQALKDCTGSVAMNTDWIQCAKDAVQLASDVDQLVLSISRMMLLTSISKSLKLMQMPSTLQLRRLLLTAAPQLT
eukprot:TRINITY_DN223_c0_g1_i18.p1 TRINITY_DN223_c0_g1~~TRINITY_DN223_c0_g1_i18.p1  ORF type:complete len:169 (-),score=12.40 TRINITY_DN223_c0_g1_i18:201-707(-)